MHFDWREYLKLARFLQGQNGVTYSQEAAFRSAVSRAYYAAYCYARNYAKDYQGFRPSGYVEDHEKLRKHFQDRGQLHIVRDLRRLRGWRNQCDYDDVIKNFDFILRSSLQRAEKVIRVLK